MSLRWSVRQLVNGRWTYQLDDDSGLPDPLHRAVFRSRRRAERRGRRLAEWHNGREFKETK